MEPTRIYLLRAAFGAALVAVGWWMSFRPDKVNHYFGNPIFSRTPLMASPNRVHSTIFGAGCMVFGVIVGVKNALILLHRL